MTFSCRHFCTEAAGVFAMRLAEVVFVLSVIHSSLEENCQLQKKWILELLELSSPVSCEGSNSSRHWSPWNQTESRNIILITVQCLNAGPFTYGNSDNTITQSSMQNRVFPNVHLTNSLHCNASDLKIPGVDGGLESTNATSTVCTVMGQLAELYSAGKMAAYNERSGCIVTMTASDFSQLPEAMGALESTDWVLGWIVDIPKQFWGHSIHVHIEQSRIYHMIHSYRGTLSMYKESPGNVDVRLSGFHGNVCEHISSEYTDSTDFVCEMIGTVTLGLNDKLAVVRTAKTFVVLHYDYGLNHWALRSTFPNHISKSELKNETWTLIKDTNETNAYELHISSVHGVGSHFILLMGKQLLISYDMGLTFYWREGLLFNSSFETSFIETKDSGFLLGEIRENENGNHSFTMRYGSLVTGEVFKIHPYEYNYWWRLDESFMSEHAQCHIKFHSHGDDMYIRQHPRTNESKSCNATQQIPLSTLVANGYHQSYSGTGIREIILSQNSTDFGHWWLLLGNVTDVGICSASTQCPVRFVQVDAPACEKYTRIHFKFDNFEVGTLKHLAARDNYKRNCSLNGSSLPPWLFLTPTQSYTFTVQYYLNRGFEHSDVRIIYMTVPSNGLNISAHREDGNTSDTVHYKITIAVVPYLAQFVSGTVHKTVHVMFKLLGVGLGCMEDSQGRLHIMDILQTTVHIGCQAHLRAEFNPARSTSGQKHYCTSTQANVICLYYEKEFYPKFEVVDEISGKRSLYIGQYIIRTIAGGNSPHSLTPFGEDKQNSFRTDSGSAIWAPLDGSIANPVFTSGNGMQWICGPSSPCASIQAVFPNSPQYTVLLEFTNEGLLEGLDNCCHFSTRFVVTVHGISMGVGSALSSLFVSLVVLAASVIVAFLCWKYQRTIVKRLTSCTQHLQDLPQRGALWYWRVRDGLRRKDRIHPE